MQAIELSPIEVELTNEEILADLLYRGGGRSR
jgi:hypothetical protein